MKNVFKMYLSCNPRFYLRHPIHWIKDLVHAIVATYYRAVRGYCNMDVWNLNDWFLDVVPCMLRQLGDKGYAYPYGFESRDEWRDWLIARADSLEKCKEDAIKNEFEDAFHAMMAAARYTEKDSNKWIHVEYKETPELQEIKDKYFERMKEIGEIRQTLLDTTFVDLAKHFWELWD